MDGVVLPTSGLLDANASPLRLGQQALLGQRAGKLLERMGEEGEVGVVVVVVNQGVREGGRPADVPQPTARTVSPCHSDARSMPGYRFLEKGFGCTLIRLGYGLGVTRRQALGIKLDPMGGRASTRRAARQTGIGWGL